MKGEKALSHRIPNPDGPATDLAGPTADPAGDAQDLAGRTADLAAASVDLAGALLVARFGTVLTSPKAGSYPFLRGLDRAGSLTT